MLTARRVCSWRLLVVAALVWVGAMIHMSANHTAPAKRSTTGIFDLLPQLMLSRSESLAPQELGGGKLVATTSTITTGNSHRDPPQSLAGGAHTLGTHREQIPLPSRHFTPGDFQPVPREHHKATGDEDRQPQPHATEPANMPVNNEPSDSSRPSAPKLGVGERNYDQSPIVIYYNGDNNAKEYKREECDIGCKILSSAPSTKIDGHMFWFSSRPRPNEQYANHSAFIGMESPAIYPFYLQQNGIHDCVGYTSLDSDVPLLYPSWTEMNFFEAPQMPKTGEVAMVVSNCGALNNRLEYVKQLQSHGITVDSFGACLRNKEFPPDAKGQSHAGRAKVTTLQGYKFTVAFENSNHEDYVTEKLFQAFMGGSIPLHMGFKNIHRFEPSPKSLLSVHDFPSPTQFAARLKEISSNVTEWKTYLSWKNDGTSESFNDIMNIASVHTQCRMCIRMADLDRRKGFGAVERHWEEDMKHMPAQVQPGSLFVRVRTRGFFYFRWIYVSERTWAALTKAITARFKGLVKMPPQPVMGKGFVPVTSDILTRIYKLPTDVMMRQTKQPVDSDNSVQRLSLGDELEVVWNWSPWMVLNSKL